MESFSFTLLICCRKRMEYFSHKLWLLLWVKAQRTTNPLGENENEFNEKTKRQWYRFFHLDLIDLDAEQLVLKFIVEIEPVSVLHIFATRVLVEDAGFSTCQRLQRTPELPVLCMGQDKKKDDVHQEVRLP